MQAGRKSVADIRTIFQVNSLSETISHRLRTLPGHMQQSDLSLTRRADESALPDPS